VILRQVGVDWVRGALLEATLRRSGYLQRHSWPLPVWDRPATQRTQRNERNERKNRKLQPIGTERSSFRVNSLFKVWNLTQKSVVQVLVGFLLVVQFMMQIKFNFNNFIFNGVSATARQRANVTRRRRWRLWLAYPIMTSFRYVPYVSSVACAALDGNPAYVDICAGDTAPSLAWLDRYLRFLLEVCGFTSSVYDAAVGSLRRVWRYWTVRLRE